MIDGNLGLINVVYSLAPQRPTAPGDYLTFAIEIVTWAEALSAIASARAKGMVRLRSIALLNNVLGVLAGLGHGSLAAVVKHSVNFPLNATRLREMRRLIVKVKQASETDLKVDWLKPFMHPRLFKAGETIFFKGDLADEVFLIVSGEVEIPEARVTLGPGEMFGEMALFTGRKRRTASAVCATEARLLFITFEGFEQLCFQNPEFGLYLTRLIVRRCDPDSLLSRLAAAGAAGASAAAHSDTEPILVHGPEDAGRALQILAAAQGRAVADLAAEALDLLFAKYGGAAPPGA